MTDIVVNAASVVALNSEDVVIGSGGRVVIRRLVVDVVVTVAFSVVGGSGTNDIVVDAIGKGETGHNGGR